MRSCSWRAAAVEARPLPPGAEEAFLGGGGRGEEGRATVATREGAFRCGRSGPLPRAGGRGRRRESPASRPPLPPLPPTRRARGSSTPGPCSAGRCWSPPCSPRPRGPGPQEEEGGGASPPLGLGGGGGGGLGRAFGGRRRARGSTGTLDEANALASASASASTGHRQDPRNADNEPSGRRRRVASWAAFSLAPPRAAPVPAAAAAPPSAAAAARGSSSAPPAAARHRPVASLGPIAASINETRALLTALEDRILSLNSRRRREGGGGAAAEAAAPTGQR